MCFFSQEKFLHNKIKVNGKAGALGDDVRVECDAERVLVMANVAFSKRYLKYLSKKYLKKHQLRDYLRVVSTGSNGYAFRYFKTGAAGDVEEED